MVDIEIKRGDIVYADLGEGFGCEQGGKRPVLVVSNNQANKFSPVVLCTPITSNINKKKLPTHVFLHKGDPRNGGLKKDSLATLEQITAIDKRRIEFKVGSLCEEDMNKIENAMKISLAMA